MKKTEEGISTLKIDGKEVLYIGPYRQNDEWGKTSRAFLQLLINSVTKVVARPLYYSNNLVEFGDITEEHNYIKEKDVIIQHGLPETLSYEGGFKLNIAITKVDCRIDNLDWVENLKLFDKICVFSAYEKQLLKKSGIREDKIFAFDLPPVLSNEPQEELVLDIPELNSKTVFYTTAGIHRDSGLSETIISYYHSFSSLDNVILIIFSNDSENIKNMIEEIKKKMNLSTSRCPDIGIISNDPKALAYAHNNYNYYINVGYNLSPNQEILDCLMGKSRAIVLDTVMFLDACFPIQSRDEVCLKNDRPIPNLYSGLHTWKVPNTVSISNAFKICHKNNSNGGIFSGNNKFKNTHQQKSLSSLKELLCIQ